MEKILGLNEERVFQLRQEFGPNVIQKKKDISRVEILFSQFKSPLIYILIIVAIISLFLGELIDASLAMAVLFVNVLMGYYQEYNAQKTFKALNRLLKPKTMVIRDGRRQEIDISELVPEDMVLIGAGDKVPADGEILQATNLLVNEAILTGEEEALTKKVQDQVFMGTTVMAGKGLVRVLNTGVRAQIGKISESLLSIKEEKTPLQVRLELFIKYLMWLILAVCLIIFIVGLFYQENIWEMLRISVVLAVAAMPEGLPIAITVILALGMRRILKRHGLVKKLLSIETLGSTSVICTDKTGTLTEGIMKVVKTEFIEEKKAFEALVFVNEQKSSLEIALWEYVKNSSNFDPQEVYDASPKLDEEPFDSEKKYSMSLNLVDQKNMASAIGAPEIIASFCSNPDPELQKKVESWAAEGLRILGVATKESDSLKEKKNYQWQGLVGIQDPIRPEAKETLAVARSAGIKIKIVTGDFRKTAEYVAKNLGIDFGPENVLEGHELEIMSEEELKERIENIHIFTRVSPHQKLKIVQALQDNGEIVAMTGDGVNDAPALKKANIGVVVGSATEVAKEVADLVLLDSNFKTIIAAVEEGRLIFSNIKKVVGYVLSNAFAEIILIFGAILLGFNAPLTVVQILWIHLICDGPPDIVLGFEPKEKDLMGRSPEEIKKEKILSRPMQFLIFTVSSAVGIISLLIFRSYFDRTNDLDLARTIAFACIGSVSLIYIFSFKNLEKSIFSTENFFTNKWLFAAVIYGFLLLLAAIYVPFFNEVLKTKPLALTHWLFVLAVGVVATATVEAFKFFNRKKSA